MESGVREFHGLKVTATASQVPYSIYSSIRGRSHLTLWTGGEGGEESNGGGGGGEEWKNEFCANFSFLVNLRLKDVFPLRFHIYYI